ncbi:MAG: helix-turn-helix domain-containing protein [Planctomycetes bacterium]|nr:helix-turn-helix domain-containing protein [Planctomycetota bacterium]
MQQTSDQSPEFLSVQQTAEQLSVSVALVYRLVADGAIEHVRIGVGRGTIRIHAEELKRYLASRES